MKSLNILVVDDNEALADVTTETLKRLGHSVTTVLSGQDALALCHGANRPFDVLITDLQMPVMSGKDVIDELGKLDPVERPKRMFVYTADRSMNRDDFAPLAVVVYKPTSRDEWKEILSEE
jgi:CheY-like chemotaxis protein